MTFHVGERLCSADSSVEDTAEVLSCELNHCRRYVDADNAIQAGKSFGDVHAITAPEVNHRTRHGYLRKQVPQRTHAVGVVFGVRLSITVKVGFSCSKVGEVPAVVSGNMHGHLLAIVGLKNSLSFL
ncbi:hypothetical protein [uncultured Lamprocystis sp.]|uniref:hypothetical protein n=1 Tax=uncultured Lamprocystis sp. TaxID=543132 RepID=UPI0025FF485D|nr:hypothetical protein [uncultured Lamprocystis sp.]